MDFVLDASVALSWCFADEATSYTDAVLDRLETARAIVPAIWPVEVCNVLLTAERRGRLTEAQTARFVESLLALPIEVDPMTVDRALGPVLSLGRAHGLSAYDAAYLELAARQGLPLATKDGRVASLAAAVGVALVG